MIGKKFTPECSYWKAEKRKEMKIYINFPYKRYSQIAMNLKERRGRLSRFFLFLSVSFLLFPLI